MFLISLSHLSSGWGSPKLWSSPALQCLWCQWHILGTARQLSSRQLSLLVRGLQVCAARNTWAPLAALHIGIWPTAHPSSMGQVSLSQGLLSAPHQWAQLGFFCSLPHVPESLLPAQLTSLHWICRSPAKLRHLVAQLSFLSTSLMILKVIWLNLTPLTQ